MVGMKNIVSEVHGSCARPERSCNERSCEQRVVKTTDIERLTFGLREGRSGYNSERTSH